MQQYSIDRRRLVGHPLVECRPVKHMASKNKIWGDRTLQVCTLGVGYAWCTQMIMALIVHLLAFHLPE